jgi:hypothetical protein
MAENGWPATPGVPENPERDGWHWLADSYGDTGMGYWQPKLDHMQPGVWALYRSGDIKLAPRGAARNFSYLGPCLLPTEVAAREAAARREGIEAALKIVVEKNHDMLPLSDKQWNAACSSIAAAQEPPR